MGFTANWLELGETEHSFLPYPLHCHTSEQFWTQLLCGLCICVCVNTVCTGVSFHVLWKCVPFPPRYVCTCVTLRKRERDICGIPSRVEASHWVLYQVLSALMLLLLSPLISTPKPSDRTGGRRWPVTCIAIGTRSSKKTI